MKTIPIPFVDDGCTRGHPWRGSQYSDEVEYYDFKKNPELIRTSLEDFKPYADQAATNRFYELLEWLNGPDSFLETNDYAFRGPAPNENPKMAYPLECHAKVAFGWAAADSSAPRSRMPVVPPVVSLSI